MFVTKLQLFTNFEPNLHAYRLWHEGWL